MREIKPEHDLTIEEVASRLVAEKEAVILRLQQDNHDLRTRMEVAIRDRDAAEKTLRLVRTVLEENY